MTTARQGISRRTFLKGAAAGTAVAATGASVRSAHTATMKGELRVWTSGSPEVEVAFDKLVGDYMKARPNVKIIHESAPYEQYFTKITTAAAGGGAPDVFWIDINTAGFAKRGLLMQLDKFVSKAYVEDAFPIALQEGMWNNARWSVPMRQRSSPIPKTMRWPMGSRSSTATSRCSVTSLSTSTRQTCMLVRSAT